MCQQKFLKNNMIVYFLYFFIIEKNFPIKFWELIIWMQYSNAIISYHLKFKYSNYLESGVKAGLQQWVERM